MSTWPNLATRAPNHLESIKNQRVVILGVGHELNGDDAVGVIVTQQLTQIAENFLHQGIKPERLIIPTGPVPENFTGQIRRFNPDLVIIIDAAHLDAAPGTVRWIPWQQTIGMSASTHSLPVSILAQYLVSEIGCQVFLIGIQAGNNEFGDELSIPVSQAAQQVIQGLVEILFSSE